MKNKAFVLAVMAVAVLGFFILKAMTSSGTKSDSPQPALDSASFVRSHSPTYGNALAKVRVVQWFDPECESCRAIHPVLKQIISEYKDRVHFVFRYMPYHGNSMFAATALEEARELGKYDEAMDILFESQPEWGSHHRPRPELIPQYLSKIGIPTEKLNRSYLLGKHGEKVRRDEADGKGVGVRGTPTFFVNEKKIEQLGDEPLRSAINAALKEQAK